MPARSVRCMLAITHRLIPTLLANGFMSSASDKSDSLGIEVVSCGFIVAWRPISQVQLLLMKHPDRWDLPKGHVDPGETFLQCAWRELEEETGLRRNQLIQDERFEFIQTYEVPPRNGKGKPRRKELRIYLAWLIDNRATIIPSEHESYEWWNWSPGLRLQKQTIDPLLSQLEAHWGSADPSPFPPID